MTLLGLTFPTLLHVVGEIYIHLNIEKNIFKNLREWVYSGLYLNKFHISWNYLEEHDNDKIIFILGYDFLYRSILLHKLT